MQLKDWLMCRVTADGEAEQKKKKKDDEKKVKKGRVTKMSDVSDDDADGGGWEPVKGGITAMVVSESETNRLIKWRWSINQSGIA